MFTQHSNLRKPARNVVAAALVLVVVLISSVSLSAGVYSATLNVSADGSFIATSASQPNLAACVVGVKSVKSVNEGKEKNINKAEVRFTNANECAGVALTVTAVDGAGRVSSGTLYPLPVGVKDDIIVTMTGDAQRNDKPEFFLNIA